MIEENKSQDVLRYASIRERDIDLIVCLAAASIPAVWQLFLETEAPPQTQHSVSTPTGEIDILLRWPTLELHVENKIDAEFQPSQPERYRVRADAAETPTEVLLLAPERYIEAHAAHLAWFDRSVTYEALEQALREVASPLTHELAEVVRYGIDQHRRGRTAEVSAERTEFFQAFAERCRASGLPFTQTENRGPKSAFFYAHNWDHAGTHRVEIVAKFGQHRTVGIQVSEAAHIEQQIVPLLEHERITARSTDAGTLILESAAPFVDPDAPAVDQTEAVTEFLGVASALVSWWQDRGRELVSNALNG